MTSSIRQKLNAGVDPAMLGRAAHRILDWVCSDDGAVFVQTPRNDWHHATKRERGILGSRVY